MNTALRFVRGDTRRPLQWVVQQSGVAVNVTGWTAKVQLKSPDLPGVVIDLAGAVLDGPGGVFQWTGFGNAISAAQLGLKPTATFTGQFRAVDGSGLIAYEEGVEVVFVAQVVVV